MTATDSSSSSLAGAYSRKFAALLDQARDDLPRFSSLHPDFLQECFTALNNESSTAAERRHSTAEIFPQLVLHGLNLADNDRRTLAAAWVALLGYTAIVDHQLDQKGFLEGRALLAASALLGWGIATFARYASRAPFANIFLENINRAFAGQYRDLTQRSDAGADRHVSDGDKNRALVAAVASFCTCAGLTDDRLVRSTEAILEAFQILDDLQDIEEDDRENNLTVFVRIARDCALAGPSADREEMYRNIIRDARTTATLKRAVNGIETALLLLDGARDHAVITFIGDLRANALTLVSELETYQSNPTLIEEPRLISQIQRVYIACLN